METILQVGACALLSHILSTSITFTCILGTLAERRHAAKNEANNSFPQDDTSLQLSRRKSLQPYTLAASFTMLPLVAKFLKRKKKTQVEIRGFKLSARQQRYAM